MEKLTPEQCRVIGVLLEKEITTPDQYPLSLNGLMVGCNQKSNREPVMNLSEADVQNIVDELKAKRLIIDESGFGSRVVKYKHRFCNTEFGSLKLTAQQLSIICVMLLRGPQTPGELRTRTNRLADFANVLEVEAALNQLSDLNGDELVIKLEREPGKRESRYVHTFCDSDEFANLPVASSVEATSTNHNLSKAEIVAKIERMEQELTALKQRVESLSD